MGNFLNRMNDNLRRFLAGRYGTDNLSQFILGVALALIVVNMFAKSMVIEVLILAGIGWSWFRLLSRNYARRAAENNWFLDRTNGIRRFFRIRRSRIADSRDYRHFSCPNCRQEIRVPRGKGHIRITCPKCRHQFEKTV